MAKHDVCNKTLTTLCALLTPFVGETGKSESAVDVLQRLLIELRDARDIVNDYTDKHPDAPRHNAPLGEKILYIRGAMKILNEKLSTMDVLERDLYKERASGDHVRKRLADAENGAAVWKSAALALIKVLQRLDTSVL